MTRIILFLIVIFLIACSNEGKTQSDKVGIRESVHIDKDITGERIDGPANIRSEINGKILFSLNDNILVESAPLRNEWFEIGVFVKLSEEELDKFRILPKTDLISVDNKILGKTIDTVRVLLGDETSGLIDGYTYKGNIKEESIPEKVLEKLINQNVLDKKELSGFIEGFKFEEYNLRSFPNITEYFIYESILLDPSPRDRISLLFEQNNLIGIIHSRDIVSNKFKTYELIRGHKLTITGNLSKGRIDNLIEMNIEFYNSVD